MVSHLESCAVTGISLMDPIQEIAGYINYWVSPVGEAYAVRSHAVWACENVLKIRVPSTLVTEHIYKEMYRLKWLRVAIGGRIMTEFFSLTHDQEFWLQREANTRKLDVADDSGRVYIRPKEDVAESVVRRLIG